MLRIENIQTQSIVDSLCGEYRQIDALLCYPKHGLPGSLNWYMDQKGERKIWHMTRYFRNVAALEKYEALIERLDPFMISIEYFRGEISLLRQGKALDQRFLDMYFASILADSFRSTLDIYSKFLGWFFDFPERDTMGFSYDKLVVPLKAVSEKLSVECNSIYKSASFILVKSLRDAEKHEGIGKHDVSISNIGKTLEIKLKRPEVLDRPQFEEAACSCLADLCKLLATTTLELQSWPMGYESYADKTVVEDHEGFFRMP